LANLKWYGDQAMVEIDTIVDSASREAAQELKNTIISNSNDSYPPSSKPGQYPKKRTGSFVDSLEITENADNISLVSGVLHGLYLQEGTSTMDPRPWLTLAIEEAMPAMQDKYNI
jgi:hypothetical protein